MSCGQCDIACTVTSDYCISDNVTWLHMSDRYPLYARTYIHSDTVAYYTYVRVHMYHIHIHTYTSDSALYVLVTLCFHLGHSHSNIMHCLVDSCPLDVLYLLETVGTRTESLHH